MMNCNQNPKQIRIHCATSADIPAWLTLVLSVAAEFPGFQLEEYKAALEENIARKSALFAEIDGVMAGVLLFSPEARELLFLAVLPKYRRFGVASALISRMLLELPAGDVSLITFCAGDPKGEAARALYQKFGFVPTEICRAFDYPAQRFVLPEAKRNSNSQTGGEGA